MTLGGSCMIDIHHPSPARYGRFLRVAHWTTVALVLLAYAGINARSAFVRGSPERIFAVESHFLLGMLVLLINLPRIAVRLRQAAPRISPPLGRAAHLAAASAHAALFAFVVVQPMLGIASRLVSGKGIALPGGWTIPSVGAPDIELAHALQDVHVVVGEAFYWVIGLHVLAALWHRWIRRDDVLQRML